MKRTARHIQPSNQTTPCLSTHYVSGWGGVNPLYSTFYNTISHISLAQVTRLAPENYRNLQLCQAYLKQQTSNGMEGAGQETCAFHASLTEKNSHFTFHNTYY